MVPGTTLIRAYVDHVLQCLKNAKAPHEERYRALNERFASLEASHHHAVYTFNSEITRLKKKIAASHFKIDRYTGLQNSHTFLLSLGLNLPLKNDPPFSLPDRHFFMYDSNFTALDLTGDSGDGIAFCLKYKIDFHVYFDSSIKLDFYREKLSNCEDNPKIEWHLRSQNEYQFDRRYDLIIIAPAINRWSKHELECYFVTALQFLSPGGMILSKFPIPLSMLNVNLNSYVVSSEHVIDQNVTCYLCKIQSGVKNVSSSSI